MTAAERRLALALAVGGLVVVLDTTIAVVATPALVRIFDSSLATMQWTTTGYVLALVSTMTIAPWLGRRVGQARLYGAALLAFAVASLAAAAAVGPVSLVAARVLQGLAGGLVVPFTMSLGLRGVPAGRRGRVAAVLGLPVLVGPLVGPVLAGALVDQVSWRALFLVVVPPALLAALLVPRLAGPDEEQAGAPLDVAGVLLAVPGVVLLVLGLAGEGLSDVLRLAGLLLGLTLLGAFARYAWRTPAPLLRVRLLARRDVGTAALVLVMFAAVYFGSAMLVPSYVQLARGDGAMTAGLLAVPAALATGISLQVCTRLVDRLDPARIVLVGLLVFATAGVLSVLVLRIDTPYAVIAALAALQGAGCGAVLMPTQTAAVRRLEGDDLASTSSMLQLLSQTSVAAGTAAVTIAYVALGRVTGDAVTGQRLTQASTVVVVLLAALVVARLWPRTAATLEGAGR